MAIRVPAVNKDYKCKTSSSEKLLTTAILCLEYRDTDKRIGLKGKRQKAA